MSNPLDIFIIEDSVPNAELFANYLKSEGLDSTTFYDGTSALKEMEDRLPKIILLDVELPDMNGLRILEDINSKGLPIAVIVITSHGSVDVAVEAMRYGASDFIEKPFNKSRLIVTLNNVIKQQDLISTVKRYEQEFDRDHYEGFIGSSLSMQVVYRIIDSAAPSKATIFVVGESGTGKELCAEAIHNKSPRADKPFVALNCAAIPKDLFESEMFGHVKGAFSGATTDRKGAAEVANGGTLFLDEICEMDLDLQSKLLRFIQTGTFSRIGESQTKGSDIRIVCATNREPLAEVAAGRFREDLYYRLNVVPISLPPLRERDADVMQIAERVLETYASEEGKEFRTFSPRVIQSMTQYDWPGNVRELNNVLRNVVVLNQGDEVSIDMLPETLRNPVDRMTQKNPIVDVKPKPVATPEPGTADSVNIRPLWMTEKDAIEAAVEQCNGNVPVAAAFLGVSASTLYRKKKGWDELAD